MDDAMLRKSLTSLAILVAAATPLTAQSAQRWSLQGSLFSSSLFGDGAVLDSVDPGIGLELQVRWTPSAFSLGAGIQWTSHKQNLNPNVPNLINDPRTTLNGVFLEPRWVIAVNSNTVAPYVSGRFAFVQQRTKWDSDTGGGTAEVIAKANGVLVNGGGGILIRLGSRVNMDLGATVGWLGFGDFEIEIRAPDDTRQTTRLATNNGGNLALRLGLAYGL